MGMPAEPHCEAGFQPATQLKLSQKSSACYLQFFESNSLRWLRDAPRKTDFACKNSTQAELSYYFVQG